MCKNVRRYGYAKFGKFFMGHQVFCHISKSKYQKNITDFITYELLRHLPRLDVDDAKLLVFVETCFQFSAGRIKIELKLLCAKHPVYLNII